LLEQTTTTASFNFCLTGQFSVLVPGQAAGCPKNELLEVVVAGLLAQCSSCRPTKDERFKFWDQKVKVQGHGGSNMLFGLVNATS